ncbi:unnamed protein product [Oncorhynchus mykiss]|uniref:Uncharacterized protein n=1 Tax=Oncorhynchus mykiss TaxID=8022 RepID=A0A060Y1A5_ONCMY|nr:unnamed protein product [Oncorhynchus mykiss]
MDNIFSLCILLYSILSPPALLDQSYGKNTLLKALLNLRDGRNNAIPFLLDISKKMGDIKSFINVAYTDSYYKGQTALHIAIERRSAYSVQLLIKEGAEVHAEACGKFFQPHDLLSFYCSLVS